MCDGSGFFEEYFDVDQTRAWRCPCCPECNEELYEESELDRALRRAPQFEIYEEPLQKIA